MKYSPLICGMDGCTAEFEDIKRAGVEVTAIKRMQSHMVSKHHLKGASLRKGLAESLKETNRVDV